MIGVQIPHVSVISKVDLLNAKARKNLDRFLEPDMHALLAEELDGSGLGERFKKLNHAIANVVRRLCSKDIDAYQLFRSVVLKLL